MSVPVNSAVMHITRNNQDDSKKNYTKSDLTKNTMAKNENLKKYTNVSQKGRLKKQRNDKQEKTK